MTRSFQDDLEELLKSQKYCDFKITCNGEEFNVHKAIICARSPVIAAAVDRGFKVRTLRSGKISFLWLRQEKESGTGVIRADSFSPKTVRSMIVFMYTQKYDGIELGRDADAEQVLSKLELLQIDDASGEKAPVDSQGLAKPTPNTFEPLMDHIHVNSIADYFDLPGLRDLANQKIKNILFTHWPVENFINLVNEAFTVTGDQKLHQIISNSIADHIEELIKRDDFADLNMEKGVSTMIIQNVVGRFVRIKDTLEQSVSELRHPNWMLTMEIERQKTAIEGMQNAIAALNENTICRNTSCDGIFDGYVEAYGPQRDLYRLRCGKCRCRHPHNPSGA
ncbi:predicted protein [Uncinocarpus reesii 1704]|uniref:BTB domain-containing protein n=1 Tax=Uncinocarpus reesii (strain UAMH 1704) TaxID=336963 RepID=C4JL34_UNCRE|nr:uncharacterized protein UREG_00249 [Uncinocarpus reesii 1704]EEP75403.1 predicted protein [Uncinocarpus reesii 1704]